jgi:hypothetical protein
MSNQSARAHWRDGVRINDRPHGACAHQWAKGQPCIRCGKPSPGTTKKRKAGR